MLAQGGLAVRPRKGGSARRRAAHNLAQKSSSDTSTGPDTNTPSTAVGQGAWGGCGSSDKSISSRPVTCAGSRHAGCRSIIRQSIRNEASSHQPRRRAARQEKGRLTGAAPLHASPAGRACPEQSAEPAALRGQSQGRLQAVPSRQSLPPLLPSSIAVRPTRLVRSQSLLMSHMLRAETCAGGSGGR